MDSSFFTVNAMVEDGNAYLKIRALLEEGPLTQTKVNEAWKKFNEVNWSPDQGLLSCSYKTYAKAIEQSYKFQAQKMIKEAQKLLVEK